jgi:hypothetical protein
LTDYDVFCTLETSWKRLRLSSKQFNSLATTITAAGS